MEKARKNRGLSKCNINGSQGINALIAAIVIRAVYDYKHPEKYQLYKSKSTKKNEQDLAKKIKQDAYNFLSGSECEIMCEAIGVNYDSIKRNVLEVFK